ncbi:MAG: hypothetical protein RJQ02_00340 [Hyphomonas sp.]|uniref:type IV toxin-antitoxin system AbiEi family antitoxin domain-containing protein n=1 Tax=Hyphomonas sp. TaxID=87 RepID=UPI0032F0839A
MSKLIQALKDAGRLITDRQLARAVGGGDARRYGLVNRALKDGSLTRIRRGLYTLGEPFQKNTPHPFVVAQALMPESYVSFETALSHYGWIPEAVYTTSSVRPGRKTLSDAPIPTCVHGRRIQRDALTGKMAKAVRRHLWRARSRSEPDRRTLAGADGKG